MPNPIHPDALRAAHLHEYIEHPTPEDLDLLRRNKISTATTLWVILNVAFLTMTMIALPEPVSLFFGGGFIVAVLSVCAIMSICRRINRNV